ncbi:hypothetical protein KAU92_01035 [Candidatus Bathyarchaeota archaeon]|nr:hypothetical protein [Candidatus Bathyarchaeota archaeon]
MVSSGRGRLFKRKDGKYLIYLPKPMAEDSMFPFKDMQPGRRGGGDYVFVKVSFKTGGKQELLVEKWMEPEEEPLAVEKV